MRGGRRWAEADAADAFWPRGHMPAAGTVPEASPFLTDQVVAHAVAMPLAERYETRTVHIVSARQGGRDGGAAGLDPTLTTGA